MENEETLENANGNATENLPQTDSQLQSTIPATDSEGFDFGYAIFHMKHGKKLQRRGWNGKGLFIFMQIPSEIPIGIVAKIQSLPQDVKDEFQKRFNEVSDNGNKMLKANNPLGSIRYSNQFAMVYPDNSIYGWVASPSDISENDWQIVD